MTGPLRIISVPLSGSGGLSVGRMAISFIACLSGMTTSRTASPRLIRSVFMAVKVSAS